MSEVQQQVLNWVHGNKQRAHDMLKFINDSTQALIHYNVEQNRILDLEKEKFGDRKRFCKVSVLVWA